ncbi:MAG: deoxyribodipyrimidine photo-lyase [Tatlockia sp.]|nr:deoxyribodipyrimidine photo-lyase [Tatlockia sp.]
MSTALFWFRRDLRLSNNPAFTEACNNHQVVIPIFILDKKIAALGQAQQWWLHYSLLSLEQSLKKRGLKLVLRSGDSFKIIEELSHKLSINTVYWNRCFEPLMLQEDYKISSMLRHMEVEVEEFNGSMLIDPGKITNKAGDYFKVFTPFWRHCLTTLVKPHLTNLINHPEGHELVSDPLQDWELLPKKPDWALNFKDYWQPGEKAAQQKLKQFIETQLYGYTKNRDILAKDATSKLSPHLHFGEISPWDLWHAVEIARLDQNCDLASAERFLAELGWREFSTYLLYHFPQLPQANFRTEFNKFPWQNPENCLERWQKGTTGFPIVDAGMRELWATGYMHNRVRMIVASFLCKDLLIDWRCGADWFLDTLVDADLASNSASWQWVAGSGVDSAPYFRIFNPLLQSQKFDPEGAYIRKWVPELATLNSQLIHQPWTATDLTLLNGYPRPIVDHGEARKRALAIYKSLTERTKI